MKKNTFTSIIAILLNFIFINAASGIEHYLETGEQDANRDFPLIRF